MKKEKKVLTKKDIREIVTAGVSLLIALKVLDYMLGKD